MSLGKAKKIAIIGSAPSSIHLGPYADPEWEIWGCSPGVFGNAPRTNVWFELHKFYPANPGRSGAAGTAPHFSPEYTAFLESYHARFIGPVMMSLLDDTEQNRIYSKNIINRIPGAVPYPYKEMIEKHGEYFWTSTVSWMLALAIDKKPEAIGLWGVDMASTEEYAYQRPACQHFISLAASQGIEIVLPPESDLMQPPFKYGLDEFNPRTIKIRARKREFAMRLQNIDASIAAQTQERTFLQGAMDDAKYMEQSWAGEGSPDPIGALSANMPKRKKSGTK